MVGINTIESAPEQSKACSVPVIGKHYRRRGGGVRNIVVFITNYRG